MSVQSILSGLKIEDSDSVWRGKPNEWLRRLSPPALNDIAIRLVHSIYGGSRSKARLLTHKIFTKDMKIDVRIATQTAISGKAAFGWRSIRNLDEITHLAFVAIYPSNARLFLVPVREIPDSFLKSTNVDGVYQIVLSDAANLPDWLTRNESKGEDRKN